MNSRRYPRTLDEAFGPYTSHQIEEPQPARMCRQDLVITWFCVLVLLAVLTADLLGWIR